MTTTFSRRRTVRRLLGGIAAVVVLAGCRWPAKAAGDNPLPDALVQPYLAIQESLAKDTLDGVSTNAAAVAAAARSLGAGRIDADARTLQPASTLADAREKFGTLSETLVAYAKEQGRTLPSGVRQAYCPMAKKPWLQRGSTISNPYYGKEMPTCGEFK